MIGNYPDADTQYRQLFRVLCDIEDVAGYTPAVFGESAEWMAIVSATEENRINYCKALSGKTLFSALYGTYTVTLNDLKSILKASNSAGKTTEKPTQEEGFQEVRRRKRHSTTEKAMPTAASAAVSTLPKEGATRNFFAPVRAAEMDMDSTSSENSSCKATAPGKTGRPPPIILTSAVNLIQLQKQLNGVVSEGFKFRSTRNGTRVITRGMVDFQSVKSHLDNQNLQYYTFFPKSEKRIKATSRATPLQKIFLTGW
jgi:hypothetical protein